MKLFNMVKKQFSYILIAILGICCLAGCGAEENITETIIENQNIDQKAEAPKMNSNSLSSLEVHFIDVGQGDSTLIMCDGEAMLIDAGDNNQGTKVQNYIQKRGIKQLKYVIGTHPDADHIGGLDVILYKFDCDTVIMPKKENDTATYRDVVDAMNEKMYKQTYPIAGEQYLLGSAVFTILSPVKEYEDTNNSSVVIRLEHGNCSFLFSGDAEQSAEQDVLQNGIAVQADVLKVGHHGSKSSSSSAYLDAIEPTYAVVSCGEGNSYGHPHAETLNNLRSRGVQLFRTDEQGSIVATSDGNTLTWNCAPTESWKAGEPTLNSQSSTDVLTEQEEILVLDCTYILNTNTKKFHIPSCKSVKQMSEKNKKEVTMNRQEIIDMGYDPCKNCNP